MELERRRQERRKQSRSPDAPRATLSCGHPGRRRSDRGEAPEFGPLPLVQDCRRCGSPSAASFCPDCQLALTW